MWKHTEGYFFCIICLQDRKKSVGIVILLPILKQRTGNTPVVKIFYISNHWVKVLKGQWSLGKECHTIVEKVFTQERLACIFIYFEIIILKENRCPVVESARMRTKRSGFWHRPTRNGLLSCAPQPRVYMGIRLLSGRPRGVNQRWLRQPGQILLGMSLLNRWLT